VKHQKIWREHASRNGEINSNYGYLIFSEENHQQYNNVLAKLISEENTRQAVMIYTRPTMHDDWDRDGMSDFVCTNAVSYMLRDGKLEVVVQMRSNDVVFGYRNDYAWQKYVQESLVADLNSFGISCEPGRIFWNAASLHIYERHFKLLDSFGLTGNPRGSL
jgi:thymidylate synthase